MTRTTSAVVYNQIRDEGLLSQMRFAVYDALFHCGPATAAEISIHMSGSGSPKGGGRAGPGNVSARLVELRQLGVAAEIGERVCRVTARNVIEWELTNSLPSGQVVNQANTLSPEGARAALAELRKVRAVYQRNGYAFHDSLVQLGRWLRDKYEKK